MPRRLAVKPRTRPRRSPSSICALLALVAASCSSEQASTDAAAPFDQGKDRARESSSAACGLLTEEGCCDGQTVWYCESGATRSINCASNRSCGWSSEHKYYDCGTGGGSESTGAHPKPCTRFFGDAGPARTDSFYLEGSAADRGAPDLGPADARAAEAAPADTSAAEATPAEASAAVQ
jgi:hypothetical protein